MRLSALLMLLLTSSAFAAPGSSTPAKDEPPFTLTQAGFQIGLNFSTLSTNTAILPNGTDGHTGLILGAQAEMSLLSNFLFLQPEFRLVQQGYALTGQTGTNVTVNYLEFPVLAKVKFETAPGMRPFALFGPNFEFNVGTSYDSAYGNNGPTIAPIHTFNFALDFGAGLEYDITPAVNFFGEVRYSLGLANINGLSGSTVTEQFRSFELLAGLNFAL